MTITIKDTIAIITVIGTLIIFFIKTIYNFFIANIKRKYREVPGNQSLFDIIIEWISCISFVLFLILMIILIKKSFSLSNDTINIPSKKRDLFNIGVYIFQMATIIATIISMYKTFENFSYLQDKFKEKLKGNFLKLKNKIERDNYIYIILLTISFVFSGIYVPILISDYITMENTDIIVIISNYDDIEKILVLILINFFSGIFLLVTINLKEIIQTLRSNDVYVIITDEEIHCKLYLEFKDYYLVIKNDTEKYISKSKVKEIRKIKEL